MFWNDKEEPSLLSASSTRTASPTKRSRVSSPPPASPKLGSDTSAPTGDSQFTAVTEDAKPAAVPKLESEAGPSSAPPQESFEEPSAVPQEEPKVPPSPTQSVATQSRNLDLRHNDNTFHVLADLVVSYFTDPAASNDLNSMLPPSAREDFVEAVRYRIQHNCPSESGTQIHVLTRRCKDLGLDREDGTNPLYAMAGVALPAGFATTDDSAIHFTNAPTNTKPPSGATNMVSSVPLTAANLPPQHISPDDDGSIVGSVLTGTSVTEAHASATENLARQQLMAELRDATKFMAESKTSDAAEFWKEHVVKLQARLRALHIETPSSAVSVSSSPHYDEVLQAHLRLRDDEPEANPSITDNQHLQTSGQYIPPSRGAIYPEPSRSMDTVTVAADGATSTELVDVVAPADLPTGFVFEAEIEGKRFLATVPVGGVYKGETFKSDMRDVNSREGVPRGDWRDSLFDCGAHGMFHAHLLNGLWCPLLALGQVMTRTGLDFMGRPSRKGSKKAYTTMWKIILVWLSLNVVVFAAYNYKWYSGLELSVADWLAIVLVNGAFLAFAINVVSTTRAALRTKHHIPEKRCFDLEDFYCAAFCLPCSVCQMERHTVNYAQYEAECWSMTGLVPGADIYNTNCREAQEIV